MMNSVETGEDEDFKNTDLARKQHVKYFLRYLRLSPSFLAAYDCSRLTQAFFALSGLDILGALDAIPTEEQNHIIEWIYSLQILPTEKIDSSRCGFQGSHTHIIKGVTHSFETGHLAMTYTALASLVILGDDLSRINKEAILDGMRALQQNNGSFCGTKNEEADMRYVYCAACISYILNDFSAIDIPKMINFITSSINYDGGIGQGPQLESHGGSTFCGVAALYLCGLLEEALNNIKMENVKRWCIYRQKSGFQGRPNKPVDTCYSFWIGGTLSLLNSLDLVDFLKNKNFIMSTQNCLIGGFSKWPNIVADPLHTYLGLCGLSLMNEFGLTPIKPALNITERAHQHLRVLHELKQEYNFNIYFGLDGLDTTWWLSGVSASLFCFFLHYGTDCCRSLNQR